MMPMNIEVLEDMEINKEKYSLLNAGQKLQIPYLIIQGTNDAVKMEEFDLLKKHFLKLKPDYFRSQSCFWRFTSLFWYRITRAYSRIG
jgi:hypothetical protein